MGLFGFLFDNTDHGKRRDEPSAQPAPETVPDSAPDAPTQPLSGTDTVLESNSFSAHPAAEQHKKTAPMRVTPIPVTRRTASPPKEETQLLTEKPEAADVLEETLPTAQISQTSEPVAPPQETEAAPKKSEPEQSAVSNKVSPDETAFREPAKAADSEPAAPSKNNPKFEEIMPMKKTKKSDAEQRIVLKLHGTSKPHCLKALETCFTGQQVFISYDAKRSRCFVYTEEGEEIGRLSRNDSKTFAQEYDACIHSTYITKIKKDSSRYRVKLLLLISAVQPFPSFTAF